MQWIYLGVKLHMYELACDDLNHQKKKSKYIFPMQPHFFSTSLKQNIENTVFI